MTHCCSLMSLARACLHVKDVDFHSGHLALTTAETSTNYECCQKWHLTKIAAIIQKQMGTSKPLNGECTVYFLCTLSFKNPTPKIFYNNLNVTAHLLMIFGTEDRYYLLILCENFDIG